MDPKVRQRLLMRTVGLMAKSFFWLLSMTWAEQVRSAPIESWNLPVPTGLIKPILNDFLENIAQRPVELPYGIQVTWQLDPGGAKLVGDIVTLSAVTQAVTSAGDVLETLSLKKHCPLVLETLAEQLVLGIESQMKARIAVQVVKGKVRFLILDLDIEFEDQMICAVLTQELGEHLHKEAKKLIEETFNNYPLEYFICEKWLASLSGYKQFLYRKMLDSAKHARLRLGQKYIWVDFNEEETEPYDRSEDIIFFKSPLGYEEVLCQNEKVELEWYPWNSAMTKIDHCQPVMAAQPYSWSETYPPDSWTLPLSLVRVEGRGERSFVPCIAIQNRRWQGGFIGYSEKSGLQSSALYCEYKSRARKKESQFKIAQFQGL